MEELSGDMKKITENVKGLMSKSEDMMTKNDMKVFIKTTVEEIMTEINRNIELTIELKLEEKTRQMKSEMESLKEENDKLKQDLSNAQKKTKEIEEIAKLGLQKANQNEQYSRKNNVKILNIEEQPDEDEISLMNTIGSLLQKQSIMIAKEEVVAIHRIPGKPGTSKPVLIKFRNNNDKTRIMRNRTGMKALGYRLVDDVTRQNTTLISKLYDHPLIESAWYFNGSVYGKTTAGKRLKFDILEDIDAVISKFNK